MRIRNLLPESATSQPDKILINQVLDAVLPGNQCCKLLPSADILRLRDVEASTLHRSCALTGMQFICDAPGHKSWFRIETEGEAALESDAMRHAVEKYFRQAWDAAAITYKSLSSTFIEQNIGLRDHVQRTMPLFLTLRDSEGNGLATAMLPPDGHHSPVFRVIIVGPENRDPYPDHGDAIRKLGEHFGLTLDRDRCYPYAGTRSSWR